MRPMSSLKLYLDNFICWGFVVVVFGFVFLKKKNHMMYLPLKTENQTLGPSKSFPFSYAKLANILLRLSCVLKLYSELLKNQSQKI